MFVHKYACDGGKLSSKFPHRDLYYVVLSEIIFLKRIKIYISMDKKEKFVYEGNYRSIRNSDRIIKM